MRDLSMHILDICMNSIRANATLIEILIDLNREENKLYISIKDNGDGMDERTLKKVIDPFYTTRKTRAIGLGVPLLKATAERCDGEFKITSELGEGTNLHVSVKYDHIDCPPMGDLNETLITLITLEPERDYIFHDHTSAHKCEIDTRVMREVLGEVPLNSPLVIDWLKRELHSQVNNK